MDLTLSEDARQRIDKRALRNLRILIPFGIAVHLGTALSGSLFWPASSAWFLESIAMGLAALFVLAGIFAWRGRIPARAANTVATVLLSTGAIETFFSARWGSLPETTVSLALNILSIGAIVLSWRAFATGAAIMALTWLVVVPFGAPRHGSWAMIFACMMLIAALVHGTRLGALVQVEKLLAKNEEARRRLEDALRQLRESQEAAIHREKLSALGTLVAGVAHEINNPLTYMRGTVELAQMTFEDAAREGRALSASEVADISAEQVRLLQGIDRIAHITASLKRVARSSSAERTDEEIASIIESVITIARPRFGASVEISVDVRVQRQVHVNAGEIAQVLLNLLLNAADATPDRGHVWIRAYEDGDEVVVEVDDDGPAIAPDVRARLFTPFFTTKPAGTGLGLSISHRVLEDHGGSIAYEDRPGGGARFRVTIPARVQAPARSAVTPASIVAHHVESARVERGPRMVGTQGT